ncbi:MAG: hypothetical protein WDZ91_15250 [Paenibacillaceae bacterium]
MKKLFLSTILATVIISGCADSNGDNSSQNNINQPKQEEQNQENSSNDSHVNHEENIPLTFQSVSNEQKIQEVSQIEDAEIVKEQELLAGKIIIFSKQDDNEHIYGAFKTVNALYDLGVVGAQIYHESLSIIELNLFNKSLIRINGSFGANAPVQNYFSIEDEKITPVLRVETGQTVELDLDGDGSVEIVSSHGTPMTTYIYEWEDGEFSVSNVNESLNAISINLTDDKKFNVQYKVGSNTTKLFEYKMGKLKPLN